MSTEPSELQVYGSYCWLWEERTRHEFLLMFEETKQRIHNVEEGTVGKMEASHTGGKDDDSRALVGRDDEAVVGNNDVAAVLQDVFVEDHSTPHEEGREFEPLVV